MDNICEECGYPLDSLYHEYFDYILDEKETTLDKKILFEILEDFADRRGLRQGWDEIDRDIQEEILQVWLKIIRKHFKKG